jgi:hypothetical protein
MTMLEIQIPEVLPKSEYLKLPPNERELYVREILRQTVRKNVEGVTASTLAQKLPFDSRTIEKHLSVLTCTNEIYSVKIGNTQLYLPNSIPMHHVKKQSFEIKDREYVAYALRNRMGEFVFIQEKKKTEFTEEVGGGILIPLADFKQFVGFITTFSKDLGASNKGS